MGIDPSYSFAYESLPYIRAGSETVNTDPAPMHTITSWDKLVNGSFDENNEFKYLNGLHANESRDILFISSIAALHKFLCYFTTQLNYHPWCWYIIYRPIW